MYADATKARMAEELQRFQGTWVQVACQIDGVKDPLEAYGLHPRVTFSGRKYALRTHPTTGVAAFFRVAGRSMMPTTCHR